MLTFDHVHVCVSRRPDWPLQQKGLTFKVESGSFVAICGRNGSGKSTLFSLIMRLYEADAGQILVGGSLLRVVSVSVFTRL